MRESITRRRYVRTVSRRRVLALAVVLAAGACSVAGATPHGASRAPTQVWFAPLPRETVVGRALGFDGSKDFDALFERRAAWSNAAANVDVFKLYAGWVANEVTLPELRRIVADLDRREIALAVEDGALLGTGGCGAGVEGFVPEDEPTRVASRIAAAGGTLAYVALDSTFRFGSLYDGPNACRFSAEEAARQFARYVTLVRRVFPAAVVGDIEALPPGVDPAVLVAWMDTYRRVTGSRLAFFHLDMGYRRLDWPEAARYLEAAARARGIPFGIIYNGEGSQLDGGGGSDTDWATSAERRFVTFEAQYGGGPDHAVLQSWVDHPDFALPETVPSTFSWLIRRYTRPRPRLRFSRAPGRLVGRLAGASGASIGDARIELAALPRDGLGNPGGYVLSATVPPQAVSAAVGFRIGTECGCSGTSQIRLYDASYTEADGANRVPDAAFAEGLAPWSATGTVPPAVEPSDRGAAFMLRVETAIGQVATLDSAEFPVTAGARFTAAFTARVAPLSRGSGYFSVVFRRADGVEAGRRTIPLAPLARPLSAVRTRSDGRFSLAVGRLPNVAVEAWYRGDARRFPAYAKR